MKTSWERLCPVCPGPPDREFSEGGTLQMTRSRGMATEVAVMSLSAHEQQALESIGDKLSVSDPDLASLLTTFTRLTAGEDMPVREKKTRTRARWASRGPRRHRRPRLRDQADQPAGRSQRLLFRQGVTLVFGILFAVAVVVGALAISGLRNGW